MQLTPNIFKAYDIRGIVPSTLNEAVAEGLGRAFGTHALRQGERVVAVGRDGRVSGPALAQALIRGLMAAGIEVIDIGMSTTPMLYFAASTLCQSGIQVTGSHNPKDYNGFKMVLGGRAIYGDEIQGLREIMEAGTWQLVTDGGPREAGERGGSEPALGRPELASAPLGGSGPREAGERGGFEPAQGRPELVSAPLGGSGPREAGERGGTEPAQGRPELASAPLGGSGPREAGERGGDILPDALAPTWLLREPLPLAVRDGQPCHRGAALRLLTSPRRVEAGWWSGAVQEEGAGAARDYFVAQGAAAELLWVYRERPTSQRPDAAPRWFLQGLYA